MFLPIANEYSNIMGAHVYFFIYGPRKSHDRFRQIIIHYYSALPPTTTASMVLIINQAVIIGGRPSRKVAIPF
jgi:hypothetical protein